MTPRPALLLLVCLLLIVGVVQADTLVVYQGTTGNQTTLIRSQSQDTWDSLVNSDGSAYSLDSYVNYVWHRAGNVIDKYDYMMRTGESYDTSLILSNSTVTSTILTQYMYSAVNTTYSPASGTVITNFTPTDVRVFRASDYNKFDNYIISSYKLDQYPAIYTGTVKTDFTFNNLNIINKSGYTTFMLRSANDTYNIAPVWGNSNITYQRWQGGLVSDTSKRPYLTIIYTPADITPPNSITNITNATTCSSVQWNWTKPADADFNHTYTLRDNVFYGNLTNSTIGVNWSGLAASTMYNISTKTVDIVGNMNATWVNASATTGVCPTPTTTAVTTTATTAPPTVTPTLGPASDRERWCGSPLIFFQHESIPYPAGFEGLDIYPAASPEDDENVTVKDSTGEKLIDSYISLTDFPNIVLIRSGLWRFRMFHYVSTASGDTIFNYSVSIWNTTGWRYLFHVNTDPVNSLFPVEVLTSYALTTNTTILESDRIVVNVSADTDHSANVIAHFVYEGNTNTSHVQVSYLDCPERCPYACFPTTAATPWTPYISPSTDIKVDWFVLLSQWWWLPVGILSLIVLLRRL